MDGTLHLVGFANPVGLLPAFLQPVFASAPHSNAQYLQLIDESGHIGGFEEAELSDDLIATQQLRAASVGDPALHAFATGPGEPILSGTRDELAPQLAERRATYLSLPALYLAIVEFCGLDEVRNANRRAYRHLVQKAGATAARSWRDSQIVLPIIRGLLAGVAAQTDSDDTRLRRVSVYSTAPSRLRVQAEGYDPSAVSNVLRSRRTRDALAATGLADKVSIALVAPLDPARVLRPKAAEPRASRDDRQTVERSSLEMALEELVERGLSTGLRRWLEDQIHKGFRKESDDFPYYVMEWCERQPISRAAIAYARLLTLASIPITLFRDITHWLASRMASEDVGPVYAPAISLLRAREAHYLTPSHRLARGAIMSSKQASRRTPPPLINDDLRDSEIPIWSLRWIEENRNSPWTPQILQALIELPFDLPPVLDRARDWFERNRYNPDAGALLIALLRSRDPRIKLGDVVGDVARWVEENHRHTVTPRLLTTMLSRTRAAEGSEPFNIAQYWLLRRKPGSDVLPLLSALLRAAPSDKALTRYALKLADLKRDVRAAPGSLALLLDNPDLPNEARWHAEHWLEANPQNPAALAVFEAYFRNESLYRRKPGYARRALALIQLYPTRAGAGPLLANLLARFPDNDAVLDAALAWLAETDSPGPRGRPVVLALLGRKGRKRRARIRSVVRRWLASHRPDRTVAEALAAF